MGSAWAAAAATTKGTRMAARDMETPPFRARTPRRRADHAAARIRLMTSAAV